MLDIDRSGPSFEGNKVDKENISERIVDWFEKPYPREGKTLEDLKPKPKKQNERKNLKNQRNH